MKKLALFLLFTLPCVSLFGADIYLAGDSTMCNYSEKQAPQQGWGNALPALSAQGVTVSNQAIGGRSVKSFRNEQRWQRLLEQVKEGDYVLIQFGHNDANRNSEERYADRLTTFPELLTLCVREVKEKKAHPVLVSTTARWSYTDENRSIGNGTLGAYARAMQGVAEKEGVPFVDLNAVAVKKLIELGPDETKKFYMVEEKNDTCHLTTAGARAYAEWFVEAVKAQKLPLAELFQ